jgi:RNA polymerase sigma factor (sigma-70 family)
MIDAEALPETLAIRAAALFQAFRDGDEAKMGELVALLTPILWHTVRSQNLARDSAEDVLQVAWLALIRNAGAIADPRAVLQWLIVTARREAWRVARVENRIQPHEFEADDVIAPVEQAPDTTVLRNAGEGRLWEHIARLPERCRQLLRVIAFADRPDYAVVAAALGMPIGSIGPTRGRCLAKLRAQLSADSGWEFT